MSIERSNNICRIWVYQKACEPTNGKITAPIHTLLQLWKELKLVSEDKDCVNNNKTYFWICGSINFNQSQANLQAHAYKNKQQLFSTFLNFTMSCSKNLNSKTMLFRKTGEKDQFSSYLTELCSHYLIRTKLLPTNIIIFVLANKSTLL